MAASFKPGDVVIWWKRIAGEFAFPVKAVVLAVTAKRIKIQADDPEEGHVVRHVAPGRLQHHQEPLPARAPAAGKRPSSAGRSQRPLKPQRDPEREQRITDEVVVDCGTSGERALGWYSYLESQLRFPFTAQCSARRTISPLQVGDEVEVIGMAPEEECRHEMFVMTSWERDGIAIPLAQLQPVVAGEETRQAVEDWHYWVRMGYLI